jgi:glucose-6-phosphate 1-dehydrogenase
MSDAAQQTLLILGASGDLAGRLLLPGLGALLAGGAGKDLLLVGSGRHGWDDDRWRKRVADSFAAMGARGRQVDAVVKARATSRPTSASRATCDGCSTPVKAVWSSSSPCRRRSR